MRGFKQIKLSTERQLKSYLEKSYGSATSYSMGLSRLIPSDAPPLHGMSGFYGRYEDSSSKPFIRVAKDKGS
jgi:hypothetical protein